jgi:hypothetical protein
LVLRLDGHPDNDARRTSMILLVYELILDLFGHLTSIQSFGTWRRKMKKGLA